jgi:predicted RNase H-like nuclease (RuvC/YqgF family)
MTYREHVNFSEIRQSESFQKLDEKSQRIVDLIVQQQDVFTNSIQKQTEEIKALHAESKATVIEQHTTTRVEIVQAIQVTKESSEADQVATRQEIANLKAAIKELSEQMKQKDAELSQFLKEFREARTEKKKKALQERSNAVSATLLALEMIYRSLQVRCQILYPAFMLTFKGSSYQYSDTNFEGLGTTQGKLQLACFHVSFTTEPGD